MHALKKYSQCKHKGLQDISNGLLQNKQNRQWKMCTCIPANASRHDELNLIQIRLCQMCAIRFFGKAKADDLNQPWEGRTLQNSSKLVQHYKHDLITTKSQIFLAQRDLDRLTPPCRKSRFGPRSKVYQSYFANAFKPVEIIQFISEGSTQTTS